MKEPINTYLIIGNSAGGIGAAEVIRNVDKVGKINIISDEPYPAYSRPLISEYLAEKCSMERMQFRPADFYERNDIQIFLGKRVEKLDTKCHYVKLENGKESAWEKLLLATGGLPIIPRLKGVDLGGVFTFTTLDDAKAIDQFLEKSRSQPKQAVVIGGGLIGVSATEALVMRGLEVAIVEMQNHILNTVLDAEASAIAEEIISQAGVNIFTGQAVTEIVGNAKAIATGVTLKNGMTIPGSPVIIAIGVQPRMELAAAAGLKINRGIVVDRHMATSHPDIYACGDAAEAYDFVYGENRLTPVWPNAYTGGRIAGYNMAGIATEYHGGTAMNSLQYFGLEIVSAGMINPPDSSYETLSTKYDGTYRKFVLKEGRLMGLVFTGNIEKSGIAFNLMKDDINVESFKPALVSEDFGLASLPEELWRIRLEAEPSALTAVEAGQERGTS